MAIYIHLNCLNRFTKVGSEFCRIQNKLTKNSLRLLKFRKNGEILPNLVTLFISEERFLPLFEHDRANFFVRAVWFTSRLPSAGLSSFLVLGIQCDQMARFLFQCKLVCEKKIPKVGSIFCQKKLSKYVKEFKILRNCLIFAKSGLTGLV